MRIEEQTGCATKQTGCPGCSGCSGLAATAAEERSGDPLTGGHFVAASVGVFLMPLGLAVAGAMLFGESPIGEWTGGVAGLVLGLVLAVVAGKIVSRAPRSEDVRGDDPGCDGARYGEG